MLAFEVGIVNDRYLRFWFTFFFIARDASKHKLINLHTGILNYPSSRVPYQFSWLWGRSLELLLLLRGQIFTLAGTRILFSHNPNWDQGQYAYREAVLAHGMPVTPSDFKRISELHCGPPLICPSQSVGWMVQRKGSASNRPPRISK